MTAGQDDKTRQPDGAAGPGATMAAGGAASAPQPTVGAGFAAGHAQASGAAPQPTVATSKE
jgi:hypothetical protein